MSEDIKLKVGRRYRLTRTHEGKAVSVDSCPDPCVKLEDEDGGQTGYLDTSRYDVEDLGPEKGHYIDAANRLWLRTSTTWIRVGPPVVDRSVGGQPSFPIQKVTIGDEVIHE